MLDIGMYCNTEEKQCFSSENSTIKKVLKGTNWYFEEDTKQSLHSCNLTSTKSTTNACGSYFSLA